MIDACTGASNEYSSIFCNCGWNHNEKVDAALLKHGAGSDAERVNAQDTLSLNSSLHKAFAPKALKLQTLNAS